jgi:N utilization substance protein B
MGARRKAREHALKILYAREVGGVAHEETIARYFEDFEPQAEGREFAETLVRGTVEHLSEIDAAIQEVSAHWRISRMAAVDRNILRMAAFELRFLKDAPKRVVLNEAIEIARHYGAEDSWAFINGILDKLAEDVEDR